jgi:CMP-N-acetylneuraminic acid synthetase
MVRTIPWVLVIIPARGGSKRIRNKNIRLFAGKPLVVHAIEQAKQLDFVGRIIVDTDSKEIATVAKQSGAEVPFLRPQRLAQDKSQMIGSLTHLLKTLKEKDGYSPDYILLLQPTSPLREVSDIGAAWRLMKESDATSVVCVCPTHPQLYYLEGDKLALVNKPKKYSSNTQAWRDAYILNGSFVYIVDTVALLREKRILTKNTRAVICPKWRSVDLDTPEEWVLAEYLYKNRAKIARDISRFK